MKQSQRRRYKKMKLDKRDYPITQIISGRRKFKKEHPEGFIAFDKIFRSGRIYLYVRFQVRVS